MGIILIPFFIGAFAGAFIAANVGHSQDMFAWAFWWGVIAEAIAVVIWIIYSSAKRAEERAKQEQSKREAERRAQEEMNEQRRQARDDAARIAVYQARTAVQAFQYMPEDLKNASAWSAEAKRFRADGAYSPFWNAVERGFACLAAYRDRIAAIESAAKVHAQQISRFAANGGDPTEIAEFPVRLSVDVAMSAPERPLRNLDAIVYDAQKDAVFAQIWEQRRTTSAIISGFQNLEQAVYQMGSAISSSIQSLGTSLNESNSEISSTLRGMTGTLVTASSEQVQEMRALNETSRKIYDEVFESRHGGYPLT